MARHPLLGSLSVTIEVNGEAVQEHATDIPAAPNETIVALVVEPETYFAVSAKVDQDATIANPLSFVLRVDGQTIKNNWTIIPDRMRPILVQGEYANPEVPDVKKFQFTRLGLVSDEHKKPVEIVHDKEVAERIGKIEVLVLRCEPGQSDTASRTSSIADKRKSISDDNDREAKKPRVGPDAGTSTATAIDVNSLSLDELQASSISASDLQKMTAEELTDQAKVYGSLKAAPEAKLRAVRVIQGIYSALNKESSGTGASVKSVVAEYINTRRPPQALGRKPARAVIEASFQNIGDLAESSVKAVKQFAVKLDDPSKGILPKLVRSRRKIDSVDKPYVVYTFKYSHELPKAPVPKIASVYDAYGHDSKHVIDLTE